MTITFDKITGYYLDHRDRDQENQPRHKRYESFHDAYTAAEDGDHVHLICGRQSQEPTRCMCNSYSISNVSNAWSRCEYCGCL